MAMVQMTGWLVNGNECELTVDEESFCWNRVNKENNKKSKRILFEQTIAIKRVSIRDSSVCKKFKIYYAKRTEYESGQLLKVKRLSIREANSNKFLKQTDETFTSKDEEQHDNVVQRESKFSKLLCLVEQSLRRKQESRPKRLLIFVNPYGGKGKANHMYKTQVCKLLELADIETKLVITKYANHALDTIQDVQFNVEYFDGIICIGGDGMFSELMNGLLFRYNRERILLNQLNLDKIDETYNTELGPHSNHRDQVSDSKVVSQTRSLAATSSDDINETGAGVKQQQKQVEGNNRLQIESDSFTGSDRQVACEQQQQRQQQQRNLANLRAALGGIGKSLVSPPIPIGVIGAGSTDANSYGLLGTNDVITATLNIILGKQIKIDVCSIHSIQEDRLLKFVSTFVAYGYFGDVIRESERLRWLGPSRYDVTGANNLIKNRVYKGQVRVLVSDQDGSPLDVERCHSNCQLCNFSSDSSKSKPLSSDNLRLIEREGSFIGVNAAVTACRCPQTKKGFSPSNHLANGCADLILVRPCSRMQYLQYLLRTGWTKKSAFDLKYVEAYRCRQFEFITQIDESSIKTGTSSLSSSSASSDDMGSNTNSLSSSKRSHRSLVDTMSSWNADGEILEEQSIRVKVNNQLLRVYGTGEPLH